MQDQLVAFDLYTFSHLTCGWWRSLMHGNVQLAESIFRLFLDLKCLEIRFKVLLNTSKVWKHFFKEISMHVRVYDMHVNFCEIKMNLP